MTQTDRVLWYMRFYGGITALEAMADLGIMRLASRISDLRKRGIAIKSRMVPVKNRFGQTVYVKRYELA
jgi:hypothetical protein